MRAPLLRCAVVIKRTGAEGVDRERRTDCHALTRDLFEGQNVADVTFAAAAEFFGIRNAPETTLFHAVPDREWKAIFLVHRVQVLRHDLGCKRPRSSLCYDLHISQCKV